MQFSGQMVSLELDFVPPSPLGKYLVIVLLEIKFFNEELYEP